MLDVREMLRRLRLGESARAVAKGLGVSRNTVREYVAWFEAEKLLPGDAATLPPAADQREVKAIELGGQRVEYVEVTLDDIALANKLAHQVLGRSLDDVPPHTRRLLVLLHEMVIRECAAREMDRTAYRFTRKTVREATGWGDTQLKVHLQRLVELEYLLVHGGRGQHVYELVYDGQGQGGERFLTGLLNPEKLRRSGVEDERSGSGRPVVGPESGAGRDAGTAGTGSRVEGMDPAAEFTANTTSQETTSSTSYSQEPE